MDKGNHDQHFPELTGKKQSKKDLRNAHMNTASIGPWPPEEVVAALEHPAEDVVEHELADDSCTNSTASTSCGQVSGQPSAITFGVFLEKAYDDYYFNKTIRGVKEPNWSLKEGEGASSMNKGPGGEKKKKKRPVKRLPGFQSMYSHKDPHKDSDKDPDDETKKDP